MLQEKLELSDCEVINTLLSVFVPEEDWTENTIILTNEDHA